MAASSIHIVIAGGGLAGCLAALAMAKRRPEVRLVLVEAAQRFGGNHTWSFFDTDVEQQDRWLTSPLVKHRWSDHEVYFPGRTRAISIGYNSIRSETLNRLVHDTLRPEQHRLGARVVQLNAREVQLESGERIEADSVLDARGASWLDGLELGWQKFLGMTFRLKQPHHSRRPVVMDATVAQVPGYRFVYTLPFTANEVLIEDTYYSAEASVDRPLLRRRIEHYAQARQWQIGDRLAEETGMLPVVLGGDLAKVWAANGASVPMLGLRGGFFHPTTGYSLPDAVRNAALLTKQRDLSSAALFALFSRQAALLWQRRSFYRMLNRLLFRAATPHRRYKVLEHFYRLPDDTIARFYAATSTGWDKLRILTGRPPVPLTSALAAVRDTAA